VTTTDWGAWSREAVALMKARNAEWPKKYGLESAPFTWHLDTATIRFRADTADVAASVCLIGTIQRGSFLWSWADTSVPMVATRRVAAVKRFGEEHGLGLLMQPRAAGGHPQALELLSIAGRILDADGIFIDRDGESVLYFTLHDFREEPRSAGA
jgi:hypothetical protein